MRAAARPSPSCRASSGDFGAIRVAGVAGRTAERPNCSLRSHRTCSFIDCQASSQRQTGAGHRGQPINTPGACAASRKRHKNGCCHRYLQRCLGPKKAGRSLTQFNTRRIRRCDHARRRRRQQSASGALPRPSLAVQPRSRSELLDSRPQRIPVTPTASIGRSRDLVAIEHREGRRSLSMKRGFLSYSCPNETLICSGFTTCKCLSSCL